MFRPTRLAPNHDTSNFECENALLTDWLKKHALQSDKGKSTATFVVTADGEKVIGYYSYTVGSVQYDDSPSRLKKGLARHPIPIVLLARFARDITVKGQGLGPKMIKDALLRLLFLNEKVNVPFRAIVVDAIDEKAKVFYGKFGFEEWPVDNMRMWVLMKDVKKSLQEQLKD